jgi:PilZ domain
MDLSSREAFLPGLRPASGISVLIEMNSGKDTARQDPSQERRTMRRFDMRLPATVKAAGAELAELLTETQNVSARGVFFYLEQPIEEGSRIEVTLTFPPHITLTDSVRVRFMARVLRVEAPLPASRVGVAAFIEEYQFLRSNPGSDSDPGTTN